EVGLRTGAEEDATFVHLLENDRRALRRNICAQESARQGESKRAPSGHDKGGGGQATTPFITSNDQDVVGVSCRMNSRTSSAAQPPARVTSRHDPKRVNEGLTYMVPPDVRSPDPRAGRRSIRHSSG